MTTGNFIFARAFQLLLTLLVAASLASVASSQVYDLKNDWSDSANPNGPWSIREGNNLLPPMTLSTNCGPCPGGTGLIWTNPQPAWARSSGATSSDHTFLPQWFKSNGTETGLGGWGDDWEAGDVVMHSTDPANGVGAGEGNVIWTSPISGVISISGNIWMGRDIGRANHWALYKNNSALTGGDVSSGDAYNRANPMPFSSGTAGPSVLNNVSVNVGDIIKLEINRTSGAGDIVGVNLTINAQCDWVQWTNGHYYKMVCVTNGITWSNAVMLALADGGYLATVTSAEENAFVYSLASAKPAGWYYNVFNCGIGPWLGGFQTNGSSEPAGGWSWITGEPFTYQNWWPGEPSNSGGTEHQVHLFTCGGAPMGPNWNDITDYAEVRSLIVERTTPPECVAPTVTMLTTAQGGSAIFRHLVGPSGGATALPSIAHGSFNAVAGLGLNAGGELFVANRYSGGGGNGSVSRILDPAGTPVFNGVISNGFSSPHGVDFRSNELLVVDSFNNRVRRYTIATSGAATEINPITNGLAGTAPRYLRVGPSGEVFVSQCNCGGQNDVRRFLINGNNITTNGVITGNGISNPHGIVFSPSGEMFVANYDGNSISRFTFSNGVAIANGTISGNGLSQPIGLAFSPWGELFVANASASVISRWIFSNGTAVANGTISMPQPTGDILFLDSTGGQAVFVPACTNLTVVLSAAYTNCVVSTNSFTNSTAVTTGIVGLWKADGNVFDSSVNGNHGTTHGSVTYESGIYGQAFSIPAVPYTENTAARRVELGHLPVLNSATGFTVSAWVKMPPAPDPTSSNDWTFMATFPAQVPNPGLTNDVLVRAFGLYATPSGVVPSRRASYTIAFSDGTTATVGTTAAMPTNQFAHLAVTWSSAAGSLRIYKNGVLDGTISAGLGKTLPTAAQRTPNASPLSVELGVWDFVTDTTGALSRYGGAAMAMDDFRLYTRALGSNEVQLIYNGEPPVITNTVSTNCTPIDAVTTNMTFCAAPSGKLLAFRTLSNAVELRWSSQTNAYYLLEGAAAMPPLNWSNRWGIGAGNGSNISVFESTVGQPQRYYRLFSTE